MTLFLDYINPYYLAVPDMSGEHENYSAENHKRKSRIIYSELIANHIRSLDPVQDLFLHIPCISYYEIFLYSSLICLLRLRGIRIYLILLLPSHGYAINASKKAARDGLSELLYFQAAHRFNEAYINSLIQHGIVGLLTLKEINFHALHELERVIKLDGWTFHCWGNNKIVDAFICWKRVGEKACLSHLSNPANNELNHFSIEILETPGVIPKLSKRAPWLRVMRKYGKIIALHHPLLDDKTLPRLNPNIVIRKHVIETLMIDPAHL